MLTVWIADGDTHLYHLLISEAVVDTLDAATSHFLANAEAVTASLEPGQWLWAQAVPGHRMSASSARWHPTGTTQWSMIAATGHPTLWIDGQPT